MARHIAIIHVEFESELDGPAPEAIADEIAKDIDAFLGTDSAYAPATSHLADVLPLAHTDTRTARRQPS